MDIAQKPQIPSAVFHPFSYRWIIPQLCWLIPIFVRFTNDETVNQILHNRVRCSRTQFLHNVPGAEQLQPHRTQTSTRKRAQIPGQTSLTVCSQLILFWEWNERSLQGIILCNTGRGWNMAPKANTNTNAANLRTRDSSTFRRRLVTNFRIEIKREGHEHVKLGLYRGAEVCPI